MADLNDKVRHIKGITMDITEIEFNRLCAEFMGWRYDVVFGEVIANVDGDIKGKYFNPYSDANDRNKVIEKMRIDTGWHYENVGSDSDVIIWECDSLRVFGVKDKSMEAAQIACIEKVLANGSE